MPFISFLPFSNTKWSFFRYFDFITRKTGCFKCTRIVTLFSFCKITPKFIFKSYQLQNCGQIKIEFDLYFVLLKLLIFSSTFKMTALYTVSYDFKLGLLDIQFILFLRAKNKFGYKTKHMYFLSLVSKGTLYKKDGSSYIGLQNSCLTLKLT